ncbi:MAG: hypothetical protein Q9227_006977 [Pyrenula ochraceoflavens]
MQSQIPKRIEARRANKASTDIGAPVLPPEILAIIVEEHASPGDLVSLACSCKLLYKFAQKNLAKHHEWEQIYKEIVCCPNPIYHVDHGGSSFRGTELCDPVELIKALNTDLQIAYHFRKLHFCRLARIESFGSDTGQGSQALAALSSCAMADLAQCISSLKLFDGSKGQTGIDESVKVAILVAFVVSHTHRLEFLHLNFREFGNECVKLLATQGTPPNIKRLKLDSSNTTISSVQASALLGLSSLEELEIKGFLLKEDSPASTMPIVAAVAQPKPSTRLSELYLCSCDVSEDALDRLTNGFCYLKTLSIWDCAFTGVRGKDVLPLISRTIYNASLFNTLEEFCLYTVRPSIYLDLKALPFHESLNLELEDFGTPGIEPLCNFCPRSIRVLSLKITKAYEGFHQSMLERLFSGCSLKSFPNLKRINLNLPLSGPKFSGSGIARTGAVVERIDQLLSRASLFLCANVYVAESFRTVSNWEDRPINVDETLRLFEGPREKVALVYENMIFVVEKKEQPRPHTNNQCVPTTILVTKEEIEKRKSLLEEGV